MVDFTKLSDDELKELSKAKSKRTGCFKTSAIKAQRELWERYHWNVKRVRISDDVVDMDVLDKQYNG